MRYCLQLNGGPCIAGATPAIVHWRVFARTPHIFWGHFTFTIVFVNLGTRACPEPIEGCPCLEHRMSWAEGATHAMVSHASGGQQRIREAVSERPRREFKQECTGTSFMLQSPFEELLR